MSLVCKLIAMFRSLGILQAMLTKLCVTVKLDRSVMINNQTPSVMV